MEPAFRYADPNAEPKIIGGSMSVVADWPATFIFRKKIGVKGCTSTAVGPRVILTAAHCLKNTSKGVVEVNGREIKVSCYHHPDYKYVNTSNPKWEERVSPDFALCRLDEDLRGIEFENVNDGINVLKQGDLIRLVGFGCNLAGGSDKGFGVLYEGDARVTKLPILKSYYTTTQGGAAVCFGDSGGGAYIYLGPARKSRSLVGVNSRGDIFSTSFISTTSVSGFVSWAKLWATTYGVKICGIHANVGSCRQ